MHAEEKKLIDGLFSRLRDAQSQSAPREAQAEALIKEHLAQQPAAPYYMAQAIIVQENAIQQLDARIKELEAEVENLKRTPSAPQQSSGGFLAGLSGGSRSSEPQQPVSAPASAPVGAPPAKSGWYEPTGNERSGFGQPAGNAQPAGFGQRGGYAPPAGGGAGGFLSGALQTAAGVAGGVVLGNLLMDMFHGDKEEPVAHQAAEPAAAPRAAEESYAPQENYADAGFDADDEVDLFSGDDDEYV